MSLWYAERGFSGPRRHFCLICRVAATAGSVVSSAAPAGCVVHAVVSLALTGGPGTALFSCATTDSASAPCDAATAVSDIFYEKHFESRGSQWRGSPRCPLHTSEKTVYCCMRGAFDRMSSYRGRSTVVKGWGITERERRRRFPSGQGLYGSLNCKVLSEHHFRPLAFPPSVPLPSSISASRFSFVSSPLRDFTYSFSCRSSYSGSSLPSSSTSLSFSSLLLSSTRISPPFSSFSLNVHFVCNIPYSLSVLSCTTLLSVPCILTAARFKMVKSASYRRPPRASPTGQARKPHIGPRRLSAEYVTPGVVLVKQRKFVAFNLETKRRKRHFKMYPGENVGVTGSTHLVSLAHGRVKYTHDVSRDVMIVNVLPERKEELLREDLWRYRTEHVRTVEENRHICFLRMKATRVFPKELINPPTKPELRPYHFTKRDIWENPTLPDVPIFDDDR